MCDGSTNKDNDPTCGRPLGLKFDLKTCELYIADAYFGLLKTGPNGGVAQKLATEVNGTPFKPEWSAILDGNFVLGSQTTSKNILRYWVRGPRVGQSEIFATTQGHPDNIRRNINREFWVAENSGGRGKAAKFDANGNFMEAIDGLNPIISQAQQFRGSLWIGSIVNHFVGIVRHIPQVLDL
ncbi:hypothetical protein ACLB2K_063989 [Fragaria x ananassa]